MKYRCTAILCFVIMLLCTACNHEAPPDNGEHEIFQSLLSGATRDEAVGYRFKLKDDVDAKPVEDKVDAGIFVIREMTVGVSYESETLEDVIQYVDGGLILWIEPIVIITW